MAMLLVILGEALMMSTIIAIDAAVTVRRAKWFLITIVLIGMIGGPMYWAKVGVI